MIIVTMLKGDTDDDDDGGGGEDDDDKDDDYVVDEYADSYDDDGNEVNVKFQDGEINTIKLSYHNKEHYNYLQPKKIKNFPKEFEEIFKVDYEKMFEKILFNSIERFYDNVNWNIYKPSEAVRVDLFDFFS